MLATARSKADNAEREAAAKHQATMAGLAGERSALEKQVDELRSFEREYRTRLKSYLEQQLRELTSRTEGAGAQAAAPLRRAPRHRLVLRPAQFPRAAQPAPAQPAAAPGRSPSSRRPSRPPAAAQPQCSSHPAPAAAPPQAQPPAQPPAQPQQPPVQPPPPAATAPSPECATGWPADLATEFATSLPSASGTSVVGCRRRQRR